MIALRSPHPNQGKKHTGCYTIGLTFFAKSEILLQYLMTYAFINFRTITFGRKGQRSKYKRKKLEQRNLLATVKLTGPRDVIVCLLWPLGLNKFDIPALEGKMFLHLGKKHSCYTNITVWFQHRLWLERFYTRFSFGGWQKGVN